MVEKDLKTHSFEQKIECSDALVTRCVDCIYIFLMSNLMDRVGQKTGSRIGSVTRIPASGMRALFYGC